jgi:hypothetical protein
VAGAFEGAQCVAEGKRRRGGGGAARCHVGAGEERRRRGRGEAPCELSRHERGGTGPLRQWRAAYVARARGARTGLAASARDAGAAADKWGMTMRGPVGSGWVQEGEVAWRDADTRVRLHSAGRREFKWDSKQFQTDSNLLRTLTDPKGAFPCSKKLEIKYGWKGAEIRNNFPYRDFSRFEMEFELKIRELL